MPAKRGDSGGGSLPASPVANTLADAANATITFSLSGIDNLQNALTQCTVKCATPILEAPSFGGPVYAELWLLRDAEGFALQLDKGFVQGGSYRTIVGIVGSVMYTPGDQLVVFMWNDSGAAFIYKVEYATDAYDPELVASTGAYTKLSRKTSATWVYRTVILNDGANTGAQTVQYGFVDGLMGAPRYLALQNNDTAARSATINLTTPGLITITYLNANGALGAGSNLDWPSGTTYMGIGITLLLPPSFNVSSSIAAIAVSQDSTHTSIWEIEARPPTVTITMPAGATNTPVAGYNEVR